MMAVTTTTTTTTTGTATAGRGRRSRVQAILLGALVSAALIFASFPHSASASLSNPIPTESATIANFARTVDVSSPGILREKSTAIFQAGSNGPVDEYILAIPADIEAQHLSYLSVVERRDKKANPVTLTAVRAGTDDNLRLFHAKLSKPLPSGEKTYIDVTITLTQVVRPLPEVITQMSRQYLLLMYDMYLPTPYVVEKQKTIVKVSSTATLMDVSPGVKTGNTVTYGPFFDAPAGKFELIRLHYEEPKAILVAKTLSRELEISHWGSALGVTEYWDLHHRGARIKDSLFSRIDYQWTASSHHLTNVVKSLRVVLPGEASHVYYRDDIGNVSTSNFRKGRQSSILDIRPRYPLYGGWHYSWHHTFDVPLRNYLKRDSKSGKFIFQVPFTSSLTNVTIESMSFKLALPEGATDVEVLIPFSVDSQRIIPYYTNLDSVGRPMVVIEKKNVADEYAVPIQVAYNLPSSELVRKPVVVATFVFGFFVLGMFVARLDLSITPAAASAAAAGAAGSKKK
ncbi:Ribophorin I [Zopfochytrium polystomum]|nr:Ribophorin I [Zopfochytrium polystomum]